MPYMNPGMHYYDEPILFITELTKHFTFFQCRALQHQKLMLNSEECFQRERLHNLVPAE